MNLETKIIIYKFTPQVFTLTPKGGKKIVGILLTEYPYIIGRNQLPKPVLVQKSLLSQNVQNSWKLIPIFCILYQSHLIALPSLLYQASDKIIRYHLIEIRIQKKYFIFQKTFYTNTLLFSISVMQI